jgi:hypothetical protein
LKAAGDEKTFRAMDQITLGGHFLNRTTPEAGHSGDAFIRY